jgi:hypothetical protein
LNGKSVEISGGSLNLNVLSVGVPASDAGIIQDNSFVSAINRLATQTKTIIRVVPIREWTEELEEVSN